LLLGFWTLYWNSCYILFWYYNNIFIRKIISWLFN